MERLLEGLSLDPSQAIGSISRKATRLVNELRRSIRWRLSALPQLFRRWQTNHTHLSMVQLGVRLHLKQCS